MIAAINNTIKKFINMEWLTGPFLDKEMRISSRHRRNYLLRSIYVIALLFFVAITWKNVVVLNRSMTFQRSRFAEAGRMITVTIIQFQFIATQLIAVILFCNSISNEIYHRTLGVLLTTPVTSFQIVMGKLLSKLFQILLLISISLPLLAIIRIFGGVSWGYIATSLSLTLVAVIFAGSLSLFFSVLFRRSYIVIIVTLSVLSFLYGIRNLNFIRFTGGNPVRIYAQRTTDHFLMNPFYLFDQITQNMRSPMGRVKGIEWIIYCIIFLLISFIILWIASRLLRKIALANAFGQRSIWKRFLRQIDILCDIFFEPRKSNNDGDGIIRRVWGPAVAWKEMKMKYSSREKMYAVVIIIIEVIMIVAMYIFPYLAEGFGYRDVLVFYLYILMGIGVFSTVFFSVRCIASEKESQTWCSLLMTPLSDWQIMSGKFVGILRRILPVWIMLFIYLCTFSTLFNKDIKSVFILTFLMIGIIVFLYGAGLYFSSRFKNTNSAIIACFIFIFAFWVIFPQIIVPNLPRNISRYFLVESIMENRININPFILTQTVMTSDIFVFSTYERWTGNSHNYFSYFHWMNIIAISYIIIGIIFAWRAKCLFRKNI